MANHSVWCVLLATIFYLVFPLNGQELPVDFPRCEMGDQICIQDSINDMIEHPEAYPGLGLPPINPFYLVPRPFTVAKMQLTPFLKGSAHWTNIKIYGLNESRIDGISGYEPGVSVSDIRMTVRVPTVTIDMNTDSKVTVGLVTVRPHGRVEVKIDNVVIPMTGKAVIVNRNGKNYVMARDAHVTNQIMNFKAKIRYSNNVPDYITNMVDGVVNSSWFVFKPVLDPIVNRCLREILEETFTPMLEKIPLQEFFNMPETGPKAVPIPAPKGI